MRVIHYELPDGWLECDACGRPTHHSQMNAHVGSKACQHEQVDGEQPIGWVRIDRRSPLDHLVEDLKLPAYRNDAQIGSLSTWVPGWVLTIGEAPSTSLTRRRALTRARTDLEYRATVLSGLRLIGGAGDAECVDTLLNEA